MNLIIRADASIKIGTGHVMRCLALAQAWQEIGGKAIFILNTEAFVLGERVRSQSMEVFHLSVSSGSTEDAKQTISFAHQFGADWVVVDGYHFGTEYQLTIKDSGLNILLIDDYGHAQHYYADIVLNQNISALESFYTNREPYTQLLLGTRYVLLRREFWQWQGWQRINPPIARKILVTMGGADADNVTLKVIQGLQMLSGDDLEVVIVLGGNNPHYEQIKSVSDNSRFPIRLEKNVTNMPELMAWADLAVTAGGSTCWELAFMGLPSVILILAENQKAIAEKLDDMEGVVNLGWHQNISVVSIASAISQLLMAISTRIEMTKRGQKLVDSKGSKRILRYLEAKFLTLRLMRQEDCQLLWEWSNDLDVRANSFSTEAIPWEHHVQWFTSKLNALNCMFYIAVDSNDVPVGQIRYEMENNEAAVSISIDKQFRNRGYGIQLINLGCEQIFRDTNLTRIHAYIKQENHASIRAFTQANFQNIEINTIQGHLAFHLIRNR